MTGVEITEELEKRKGRRPSPGTIYPVLKKLKERGLIMDDENKIYSLTKRGEEELETHLERFFKQSVSFYLFFIDPSFIL